MGRVFLEATWTPEKIKNEGGSHSHCVVLAHKAPLCKFEKASTSCWTHSLESYDAEELVKSDPRR